LRELINKDRGMENVNAPLSSQLSEVTGIEQVETLTMKRGAIEDNAH
jgi:hypothetical protein